MRRSPLLIGLAVIFLSATAAFGQTPNDFDKFTFASPNVSSFGKYGEIPVGLNTGVPSISIPLYDLVQGDIVIPISISYHAAGIRVEDKASIVGLGWSLNAGGTISRETRGFSDEGADGYVTDGRLRVRKIIKDAGAIVLPGPYMYQYFTSFQLKNYSDYQYLTQTTFHRDTEPDIYRYSTPSGSGSFFFTDQGQIGYMPFQNSKVSYQMANGSFTNWTITDQQGTQYKYSSTNEISYPPDGTAYNISKTSTFIDEVVDVNGNTATFHYAPYGYALRERGTDLGQIRTQSPNAPSHQTNTEVSFSHYVQTQCLESITTSNNEVHFYYSTNRVDIKGEKTLDSIKVFNTNGAVVKRIYFYYSYSIGTGVTVWMDQTDVHKRLKLDRVVVDDKQYLFDYDPTPLPSRFSNSQDMWGYYNGKDNTSLVPRHFFEYNQNNYASGLGDGHFVYNGADRAPSPTLSQAQILKKITYPTGGHTSFEYEPNYVWDRLFNNNASIIQTNDSIRYTGVKAVNNYSVVRIPITVKFGMTGINYTLTNLPSYGQDWMQHVTIELVDKETETFQSNLLVNGSPTGVLSPKPGDYYIKMHGDLSSSIYVSAILTWKEPIVPIQSNPTSNTFGNVMVGGLRVKKITDHDPTSNVDRVRTFLYSKEDNPSQSSGSVLNYPQPYQTVDAKFLLYVNCTFEYESFNQRNHPEHNYTLMSGTYEPLRLSVNGSNVMYSTVTVVENGAGKTVNTFTDNQTDPDLKLTPPQYDLFRGPTPSVSWNRGLPLSVRNYSESNQLLFESINYYKRATSLQDTTNSALAIACDNGHAGFFDSLDPTVLDQIDCLDHFDDDPKEANGGGFDDIGIFWQPYRLYSGYNHPDSTVTRTLANNVVLRSVTKFKYSHPYNDGHLSVTEKSVLQSNGSIVKETYKYAADFANITSTGNESRGVKKLKDLHVLTPVIETASYIKNRSDTDYKLLGSSYWEYYPDKPLRKSKFSITTDTPLSGFSQATVASGAVVKDSRYKLEGTYGKYTSLGKLQELQKVNDTKVSYLWGYGQQYVVAEVVNASANEIFYESFEEGNGNSAMGDSRTGKYSKTTGYNLVLSNLTPNMSYTLSYWRKVSGSWTFVVQTVALAAVTTYNTSLTGQVDEVRFHPLGAQMSTYTFEPGIGATSVTGPANVTTYFQYDSFGRLQATKDNNGNISKTFLYHYKNNN